MMDAHSLCSKARMQIIAFSFLALYVTVQQTSILRKDSNIHFYAMTPQKYGKNLQLQNIIFVCELMRNGR